MNRLKKIHDGFWKEYKPSVDHGGMLPIDAMRFIRKAEIRQSPGGRQKIRYQGRWLWVVRHDSCHEVRSYFVLPRREARGHYWKSASYGGAYVDGNCFVVEDCGTDG